MKVIVAKSAGFCFGVKRAVDMVYTQVEKQTRGVYTYGPIIHNEEVVNDLKEKGAKVIDEIKHIPEGKNNTVVIRSHGITPDVYDSLQDKECEIVDATCPFVKKIHRTVMEYSNKGYYVIVIGDRVHPEVIGIVGWCKSGSVSVIGNEEEAKEFQLLVKKPICIVSQTTLNNKKFEELVEIISKKSYDIIVVNTICNATEERQKEAQQIASQVDAMIVIGGKTSSNTKKLYEICKSVCNNTFYIQTSQDLHNARLSDIHCVGITAGASTPDYIIKEVQNYVRNEF